MKNVYVSAAAAFSDDLDLKTLIPDANMRRRMSRIVRMGVAVGQKCLAQCSAKPDAIISATGYGCVADSEKFLRTLIETDEQQLSPTPFIQSTFNTIGGYIAQMNHNEGYNVTFVNRFQSFADALLDAVLCLNDEAENVLVVVAEELTPTLAAILRRLGAERKGNVLTECAFAFMLTSKKDGSMVEISNIEIGADNGEQNLSNTPCPVSAAERFYSLCTARQSERFVCGGVSANVVSL